MARNNCNIDLYNGMCLVMSKTESFLKYDDNAGIKHDCCNKSGKTDGNN